MSFLARQRSHVLTGHQTSPASPPVRSTNPSFFSIQPLSSSRLPGTSLSPTPFSCLEIGSKSANELQSNCRGTNRQADWWHAPKKSDSRFFTSSLYDITCLLPHLLPEEHGPCIFNHTGIHSFNVQLLLHKLHSIAFFWTINHSLLHSYFLYNPIVLSFSNCPTKMQISWSSHQK